MAITIKDITELPTGTPVGTSPIIYGNGTNLFITTLDYILSQVTAGITDLSFNTIASRQAFVEGSGLNPLNPVDLTIEAGEIWFIEIFVVGADGNTTINNYLIPLGAGVYEPLGATIGFDDLILISKSQIGGNPSGSNTVTYVATDLADINDEDPALDLSDNNLIYFIDLDDGFYRFIGTNGLYGLNELQMVQGDLELIQQPAEFPQPATASPPASGTFSVDLTNFFGTDYSGSTTSLTNITIGAGRVLGGFARIKGNWATEPTITNATEAGVSEFFANTDLYLYFENWNDGVIYWYDVN